MICRWWTKKIFKDEGLDNWLIYKFVSCFILCRNFLWESICDELGKRASTFRGKAWTQIRMSRILFEAKKQLHRVAHEQTIFNYHLVVCVPPVFRSENYRGGVLVHAYYYHKWCPAEFGVSLPGKNFTSLQLSRWIKSSSNVNRWMRKKCIHCHFCEQNWNFKALKFKAPCEDFPHNPVLFKHKSVVKKMIRDDFKIRMVTGRTIKLILAHYDVNESTVRSSF